MLQESRAEGTACFHHRCARRNAATWAERTKIGPQLAAGEGGTEPAGRQREEGSKRRPNT